MGETEQIMNDEKDLGDGGVAVLERTRRRSCAMSLFFAAPQFQLLLILLQERRLIHVVVVVALFGTSLFFTRFPSERGGGRGQRGWKRQKKVSQVGRRIRHTRLWRQKTKKRRRKGFLFFHKKRRDPTNFSSLQKSLSGIRVCERGKISPTEFVKLFPSQSILHQPSSPSSSHQKKKFFEGFPMGGMGWGDFSSPKL